MKKLWKRVILIVSCLMAFATAIVACTNPKWLSTDHELLLSDGMHTIMYYSAGLFGVCITRHDPEADDYDDYHPKTSFVSCSNDFKSEMERVICPDGTDSESCDGLFDSFPDPALVIARSMGILGILFAGGALAFSVALVFGKETLYLPTTVWIAYLCVVGGLLLAGSPGILMQSFFVGLFLSHDLKEGGGHPYQTTWVNVAAILLACSLAVALWADDEKKKPKTTWTFLITAALVLGTASAIFAASTSRWLESKTRYDDTEIPISMLNVSLGPFQFCYTSLETGKQVCGSPRKLYGGFACSYSPISTDDNFWNRNDDESCFESNDFAKLFPDEPLQFTQDLSIAGTCIGGLAAISRFIPNSLTRRFFIPLSLFTITFAIVAALCFGGAISYFDESPLPIPFFNVVHTLKQLSTIPQPSLGLSAAYASVILYATGATVLYCFPDDSSSTDNDNEPETVALIR